MVSFENETDVEKNSECVLWFEYKIPTGGVEAGVPYTFTVEGPLTQTVPFNVYGEDGTIVALGTAENAGTNQTKVTITFRSEEDGVDPAYLKENVEGLFFVSAHFDETQVDNTGKQQIEIKADSQSVTENVDFEINPLEGTLTSWKSGVADTSRNQIEWTIGITPSINNANSDADKTLASLVFTDSLPEGLEYVSCSGTIKDGITAITGTVKSNADGTLTYTGAGNDLEASSWPITLKIVTKYDPAKVNVDKDGKFSFTNTVNGDMGFHPYTKDEEGHAKLDTETTNTVTAKEQTSTVSISAVKLDKSGSLAANKTITWTVTATNALNAENPRLEDQIGDGLTLVEESVQLVVYDGDGNVTDTKQLTKGASASYDGQTYSYSDKKLVVQLNSTSPYKQVLTYDTTYTTPSTTTGNATFKNTVDMYGKGPEPIGEKTAEVNMGTAVITKSGTGYDRTTHTITWRIDLKTKGLNLSNVKLEDTLGTDPGQDLVTDSFKMFVAGTETGDVDISNLVSSTSSSFTIDLSTWQTQLNENNYYITYQTKLKETDKQIWGNNDIWDQAKNKVKLTADGIDPVTVEGTVSIHSHVLSKETYNQYNQSGNRELYWKITVNENQMQLDNPVVTDYLDKAGWKYDTTSIVVMQGENSISNYIVACEDYTYTPADATEPITVQKMTITLPDMNAGDKPYVITYQTYLDDAHVDQLLTNDVITVTNVAALTGAQIPSDVTVTKTQNVGNGVLKKSGSNGSFGSDRSLEWTIKVNDNMAVIDGGGNAVAIEDVLQEGLILREDTITITRTTPGKDSVALVKDTDYTVDYISSSRKLTITFKSGEAGGVIADAKKLEDSFEIKFKTLVLDDGEYNNTAVIVSQKENSNLDASSGGLRASFSGGLTRLKGYGTALISKVNADGELLAGAILQIWDETKTTMLVEFETTAKVKNILLPKGKYVVIETKAPEGYVLPANPETSLTVTEYGTVRISIENTRPGETPSDNPGTNPDKPITPSEGGDDSSSDGGSSSGDSGDGSSESTVWTKLKATISSSEDKAAEASAQASSGVPKTADESHTGVYVAVLIGCLAGLAAIGYGYYSLGRTKNGEKYEKQRKKKR